MANDMKLNEEQRKRVQLLRGLAIVAVVFIHNSPAGLAQVFVRPFINFSVGLFLFLSGMLSNVDRWDPHKRIMKVAIPYVIWTIFYTVLHSIKSPASIPANFVVNLISARAAGVMYYVFVYCEFTLLIPLIDRFAKSRYKYLGFIISPVEIIVMRLLPLLMGFEMNRYLTIIIDVSCLGWFTYFYLGYMIGNYIIEVKWSVKKAVVFLGGALVLQLFEGYWYFCLGSNNCGTQLKLTSVLTGSFFVILAYKYIYSDCTVKMRALRLIGDNSFGIFFSHLAIMAVLGQLPYYNKYVLFPINAIVTVFITFVFVLIGKKIFGKYGRFFAL